MEYAKSCNHPLVLHVLTKKGKGFQAALKQPEKYHGLGPYDAKTGETPKDKPGAPPKWQDVFGEAMVQLCERDSKLVGITAAMPSGTGLKKLKDENPGRYYDVGIAEEHAVLFAAGMSAQGLRPVCAIYSSFLQRGYDCIIHDVALQDLPVIFCMDRAGLSAADGPTHHGLFDLAYLNCVPNVIVMQPKDEDELVDMMFTCTRQDHPTFIRYPRGEAVGVKIKEEPTLLDIGKAEVVQNFHRNGKKQVVFFGLGNMQVLASECIKELGGDFDCALVNPRFVKPMDDATHEFFAREADLVVTLEDHVSIGGYGSRVVELLHERDIRTPVQRVAWPDQFIEHASGNGDLREKYGLTSKAVVAQIKTPPATTAGGKKFAVA